MTEELIPRHTASEGHRLPDLVHIATAFHLDKTGFLMFDTNQGLLAEASRLRVAA